MPGHALALHRTLTTTSRTLNKTTMHPDSLSTPIAPPPYPHPPTHTNPNHTHTKGARQGGWQRGRRQRGRVGQQRGRGGQPQRHRAPPLQRGRAGRLRGMAGRRYIWPQRSSSQGASSTEARHPQGRTGSRSRRWRRWWRWQWSGAGWGGAGWGGAGWETELGGRGVDQHKLVAFIPSSHVQPARLSPPACAGLAESASKPGGVWGPKPKTKFVPRGPGCVWAQDTACVERPGGVCVGPRHSTCGGHSFLG
jgi:hypothetical protein